MEERYLLTFTHEDDSTSQVSGLTQAEVLQIVLEETAQHRTVWFKVDRI